MILPAPFLALLSHNRPTIMTRSELREIKCAKYSCLFGIISFLLVVVGTHRALTLKFLGRFYTRVPLGVSLIV